MLKPIVKRLKQPTPRIINKIQKILSAIGGLSTVIVGITSLNPELHIPTWLWQGILVATILNYLVLQLFIDDDFKK